MSRRQGPHGPAQGQRLGNGAPEEEAREARRIHLARHGAACLQRLHLGGEAQASRLCREVERLDPQRIAGQQEAFVAVVPDGQAVHPPQAAEHGRALTGIEGEDDLGVAVRAEAHAFAFQLPAQIGEVVDLAVEDDMESPVRRRHGLGACLREVEDGEAAAGERHAAIARRPGSGAVRTASRHGVAGAQ